MAEQARLNEGDVMAFGHTHKPWHRAVEGFTSSTRAPSGGRRTAIPRACYARLDVGADGVAVEFVRVEYDLKRAQRGILESGLPDEFADYLRRGGADAEGPADDA